MLVLCGTLVKILSSVLTIHLFFFSQINWNAVERDLAEAKRELRRSREGVVGPILSEVKDFLKDNMYLGGGFIGESRTI